MTTWVKAGKHRHVSSDGRFELVRRSVFGGNKWQIFCRGHHADHKSCPQYAIVSKDTIEEAKEALPDALAAVAERRERRKSFGA